MGKFALIAQLFKNVLLKDFSDGTVDKNPLVFRFNPGTQVQPWLGKIPNTSEQLIPYAATTEAPGPRACALQQEKPWQWKARALQLERSHPPRPHCLQVEKAHALQRRPSAKIKINNLKNNNKIFLTEERQLSQDYSPARSKPLIWKLPSHTATTTLTPWSGLCTLRGNIPFP